MRNYVIINGVNSLTIQGLAINNLPPITKPMIRTQREEIDGRDGDIVTELGYSAYDKQIEIGLWGTYDINDIIKYFTGEGTIVFSNEEDKYYNFKILDQIDYEKLLKFKTATITLHCQPFKYPLEEEPVEAEITTLTGSGETLTLNNTEEAPMSLVYKGNTYQDSTTGKNKLNVESSYSITTQDTKTINITAGTYTLSCTNLTTNTETNACLIQLTGDTTQQVYMYYNDKKVTFTTTETKTGIKMYSGTTYANSEGKTTSFTNLMLETGSTATEYEPYTNGESPNPDYPQPIQVVSGDNSIVVCGKNLALNDNPTNPDANYQTSGTGSQPVLYDSTNEGYYTTTARERKFDKLGTGTFTISLNWKVRETGSPTIYVYKIDSTGTNANSLIGAFPTGTDIPTTYERISRTYTITEGYDGLRLLFYSRIYWNNIKLEKGNQATTYEEHKGASYPISLGVENLFDKTQVANGYQTTATQIENGFNATGIWYVECPISLNNGTYTINYNIEVKSGTSVASTGSFRIYYKDGAYSNYINYNSMPYTFVVDKEVDKLMFYVRQGGETISVDFTNVELVEGSTLQHISTTPIELLKIGTYQDKIDKSSGKNLIPLTNQDFTKNNVRYYVQDNSLYLNGTSTGETATNSTEFKNNFSFTLEAGTYNFNWKYVSGISTVVKKYSDDTNLAQLTQNVSNASFTLTEATKVYIGFYVYQATTSNTNIFLALNKGTTALPYEPYGTGWYLKKEIGKVVLDGSEDWTDWTITGDHPEYITGYLLDNYINYNSSSGSDIRGVCNNFKVYSNAWVYAQSLGLRQVGDSLKRFYVAIDKNIASTLEDYKTWLGTHNTIVYYVLATPTYTLIEDSTLINQLESMKKSYENQTNISQENNDLPFELDVSVTFLTPMEINNIGNIYAKPILTIEGTGNIGVVLNDIQILDIDLTNNGKIAIDVPKLEAYNPDDDTLLNRLVTGDYMKLLINEGENTITFTGNVSGATLTNYIRWI